MRMEQPEKTYNRPAYSFFWKEQRTAVLVLSIVYAVGIAGLLIPIHPDFIFLTPLNLLFSVGLMLYYHKPRNVFFWWFIGICYSVGFLSELIGVQTGLIFGSYQYGSVLGPKLFDTPLMIGVNWVMVTYCAGMTISVLFPSLNKLAAAGLAALLMVGLDVLIEPVAITQGFWSWKGDSIPIQNFIGWFVIGFILQLLFHFKLRHQPNFVAIALFILQFLFFGILYLVQ